MKKIAALILAVILCLGLFTTASADLSQAERLGSSAVGCYATITQNGNVRAQASAYADLAGRVNAWETYQIQGITRNANDDHIWYLIEFRSGWYGWISAGITDVYGSYGYAPGDGFIIITGNGVRCRRGPGTNYSEVASCMAGNGFRVLETRMGNTGKPWYRISVQGISCWVSSGMCQFYAY